MNITRVILLCVILFLVTVMSLEFHFFTKHYKALEERNEWIFKHCNIGNPV